MQIYSVSEFVKGINQLLVGIPSVVQGEVSNYRVSQNRFVWFDLKDENSYVSCFALTFQMKDELEDGMEIQVFGNPGLFKKSGKFHIRVKKVQMVGAGGLKKEYEKLKAKLTKEGLFDEGRKRQLPRFPKRIALVTSRDAAAYTDVQRILNNRWGGLDITLFHVQVQGAKAVNSIAAALHTINEEYADDFDVAILTRGGGSMEDLQAFNDEDVVRGVFAMKIPTVVGIGHERDETLAEYAADKRASTPSNAAELIVPDKRDVLYQLQTLVRQQEQALQEQVNAMGSRVRSAIDILDDQAARYVSSVRDLQQRFLLQANTWETQVHTALESVHHQQKLLSSYNPKGILQRGYSITRLADGTVVSKKEHTKKGDTISTIIADGEIRSKVL